MGKLTVTRGVDRVATTAITTAIVLVAEFTRIDHDFLVPIILAVVGSMCVSKLCQRLQSAG